MQSLFPFSATVAQDEMKQVLRIAAVDPGIGGVLVTGDRGTGKSTTVRALAALLPKMRAVTGCPYQCDPESDSALCAAHCPEANGPRKSRLQPVPVVDLPLGATEDRVVGALDLEAALTRGEQRFQPGLLASANRGFLYIDEVNLLEDHLVDLLLDVAASGENVVEREGLSVRHAARFVLVGSCNPEEGELRPQLLDRFGLSVEVLTPTEIETRVEIIKRRAAFEQDPAAFLETWKGREANERRRILAARKLLPEVEVPDEILVAAADLCMRLGSDGLRGELTLVRAGRVVAALARKREVSLAHLRGIAVPALRHRLRRDPLDETGSAARIERAMAEAFAE